MRYKISEETQGLNALNFGLSKGQTFDRVLIYPTGGITKYLKTGDLSKAGDIPKLYVAITRARFSVAFIHDDVSFSNMLILFTPK